MSASRPAHPGSTPLEMSRLPDDGHYRLSVPCRADWDNARRQEGPTAAETRSRLTEAYGRDPDSVRRRSTTSAMQYAGDAVGPGSGPSSGANQPVARSSPSAFQCLVVVGLSGSGLVAKKLSYFGGWLGPQVKVVVVESLSGRTALFEERIGHPVPSGPWPSGITRVVNGALGYLRYPPWGAMGGASRGVGVVYLNATDVAVMASMACVPTSNGTKVSVANS